MEKCYKVVDSRNGRLWSSFTGNQYKLEYKVGEITVPKIGKIFVFKTIEEAHNFYNHSVGECLFLYECECNEITKQERRSGSHFLFDYEDFWNGRYCETVQSLKPMYTTDYVKLIREVEWPK